MTLGYKMQEFFRNGSNPASTVCLLTFFKTVNYNVSLGLKLHVASFCIMHCGC